MKLLLVFFTILLSCSVYAQGGKKNNPWQPVDPNQDVCSAFLPAGLDLTMCDEVGSTTAGVTYFCETLGQTVVVCPPDVGDDDDD